MIINVYGKTECGERCHRFSFHMANICCRFVTLPVGSVCLQIFRDRERNNFVLMEISRLPRLPRSSRLKDWNKRIYQMPSYARHLLSIHWNLIRMIHNIPTASFRPLLQPLAFVWHLMKWHASTAMPPRVDVPTNDQYLRDFGLQSLGGVYRVWQNI